MEGRRDEFERLRPKDGEPELAAPRARGLTRGENVETETVPLHPRGVGEILDLGIEILRSRFAVCVVISTFLWIPARIVQQWLRVDGLETSTGDPAQDMRRLFASFGGLGVSLVVSSIVQALASAFVAQFIQGGIEGRPTSVGDALNRALVRLPGVIVLSLVIGIASMIGFFLLCVPYIFVLWRLSLAPLIYVLEDVSIGASLSRAFRLTSSSFGYWIAIIVLAYLIASPFSNSAAAGELPAVRHYLEEHFSISIATYEIGLVAITSVFMGVATAIQTAIMTVFYLDRRVRRDGVDLHAWLARVRSAMPVRAAGDAGA